MLPSPETDTLTLATPIAVWLPTDVEVLRLGATGRIGIGNPAANLLQGNAAGNSLDGAGGVDVP